jgi:hypothetical protein
VDEAPVLVELVVPEDRADADADGEVGSVLDPLDPHALATSSTADSPATAVERARILAIYTASR